MQPVHHPMQDGFERFANMLSLAGYLRTAKRLTPSELKTLAATVRRTGLERGGNAEQVARAIESVAAARVMSQSTAMKRDAPATTLFERLSDWATASF